MKKRILAGALILSLFMSSGAFADESYVPVRQTMEKLGYNVNWYGGKGEIECVKAGAEKIGLSINSSTALLNDEKIELGDVVMLVDGTSYMPSCAVYRLKKAKGEAESSFAYKFNRAVEENMQGENYVFSPYGAKTIIAMTANGADKQTINGIPDIGIDFNQINERMRESNGAYAQKGKYEEDAVISSSNSLWLNDKYTKVKKSFGDIMTDCYNADIFSVKPSELEQKAGDWIAEKSHGMQTNFNMPAYEDFNLTLINTVYFKGQWCDRFSSYGTYEEEFTNADGSKKAIDFMHKADYTEFYSDRDITMVKLDYHDSDRDLSFYAAMMSQESQSDPEAYIDLMETGYIELALPAFKCDSEVNVKEILKNMGVNNIFAENGNLCNMIEGESLNIGNMAQNAVIDVNEWGTEAAATAVTLTGSLDEDEPVKIKFDKPFTYFIRDNDRGEILFMGRLSNVQ